MLVEIEHFSGELRELPYCGAHGNFIYLKWPLVGDMRFRKATGMGCKECESWRITDRGRATIGLPPAPNLPSRAWRRKAFTPYDGEGDRPLFR